MCGDWLSALACAHTRQLAAIARQEGLRGEDAIDAVQEAFGTFLRLPEARTLADAPEEARAMLATIVKNVARNMRRRHHRALPHFEIADAAELDGALPGADALLEQAEERSQLYDCIDQLEEVQRRVVTLRALEELSGSEVGARLGLEPGHVAVLLYRAKKHLLRCIAG